MAATTPPAGDSHFSPEAARTIFRRAAEHQEMARAALEANANGLSLADLQSIGAEAGIDPAYIAAAAAELQTDDAEDEVPWWYAGSPTIEAEAVVPGAITDGPVWAAMVRDLRDTFGTGGVATQIGDTLEWSSEPPTGGASTRVTVTPEPHGTRIRITRSKVSAAQFGGMMGGTVGISGLAAGGLIFAVNGFNVAGLLFTVAVMAVGAAIMGLSIPVYRAAVRREQEQFDALMDRLELIALKANAQSAQPEAQTPESNGRPVNGADELGAPPVAESAGTVQERARS